MTLTVTMLEPLGVIPKGSFRECRALTSISIPNTVRIIEDHAFENCRSLTSITIPDSIQRIGKMAFSGCTALEDIVIPKSVVTIDHGAFSNCEALRRVVIEGTPKLLSAGVFLRCPIQEIIAPDKWKKENMLNIDFLKPKDGCYVATAVYGSYDCPEVWTLRRFRDDTLDRTWYGRAFIRAYYAVSPTLVRWFGKTGWFRRLFKAPLDRLVLKLQRRGVQDTPYHDKY